MFMLMLLCICAAILTSLMLYTQSKNSNEPGDAYRKLEQRATTLQDQVTVLLKEQVRLSEELRTNRIQQPATESTNNEATAGKNDPAPFRQEFFAKAFLDGDYVGLARVTPVFRKDEQSGNMIFENIINLSGDARNSVIKTVTNVVERDVVRNTTMNHNYSSSPYWYAYPAWVRPGYTNTIPDRPTPTPPIARPNQPNTGSSQFVRPDGTPYWQNGGVWNPGTIKKNPF